MPPTPLQLSHPLDRLLEDVDAVRLGEQLDEQGLLRGHFIYASAPHVDADFNQGVKFLTMAVDRFRNEKSHTANALIEDPRAPASIFDLPVDDASSPQSDLAAIEAGLGWIANNYKQEGINP